MPKKPAAAKSADVRANENSEQSLAKPHAVNMELHVKKIGQLVGADVDASPDEMLDLGIQDFTRASRIMVRSGWYLLAAKQHFGHGNFILALEERDIDPRRAQEVMRFAANIQRLPAAEAEQLLTLQPSKAMALANADPEVVEDILSGESLAEGDVSDLSVRALRAHIKELSEKRENLQVKNAELAAQVTELKADLLNKSRDDHLPGFALIARHEAAALSHAIIQAVESMEDVYEKQVGGLIAGATEDDERYRDVALNSVYHAMAAAAARCYGFIDRLRQQWPDRIGGIDDLLPFSEDETERLLAARRVLTAEHRADAAQRKDERAASAPKKRGRPRKRIDGDE